jgi:hypothetical protein
MKEMIGNEWDPLIFMIAPFENTLEHEAYFLGLSRENRQLLESKTIVQNNDAIMLINLQS